MAPTADDIGSIHTSVCGRIEFSHNVKHQILIANVCNLTERKLKIGVLGAVQYAAKQSKPWILLRIDPFLKKPPSSVKRQKTVKRSPKGGGNESTSRFPYQTIAILWNKSFLLAVCWSLVHFTIADCRKSRKALAKCSQSESPGTLEIEHQIIGASGSLVQSEIPKHIFTNSFYWLP